MFTGIVTDMGKVLSIVKKGDSIKFLIQPTKKNYLKGEKTGLSMAINGACMTIEKVGENTFEFTTVNESLKKTNLGDLKVGQMVNLEKPVKLQSTLDGHIVQGHIDTTGIVKKIVTLLNSWEFFFDFPAKFRNYIIYVGSIAINGVSLTVADIVKETNKWVTIKVAIIPHTFEVTNFKFLKLGDRVNIEFDMLGKYVNRIIKG